ncbi:MAG: TonB-dependent receptor [Methylococcaceae bacterium]|nr:TonB-dependent receptor [Methylococcaceae bacterium]
MHHIKHPLKYLLILPALYAASTPRAHSEQNDLLDLSVEDLLNVEVISVAKKAKSLNDSPAAIYVISQDDIKRIGATSIPEALRIAPGINVARIDANKWAVSARGFNGRFANKLLVLIDGRNTYTRAFSGVYWENQDVMMEDIQRIEVVRGPGATLWGANAVNGVINIITKHSADTQGKLLTAGGGTEEQGFGSFRYGGSISPDTTARAYIKGFIRDNSSEESGDKAKDDWDKVQGGFRMDSQTTTNDTLTIQGDIFSSTITQQLTPPQFTPPFKSTLNHDIENLGGNLLLRHKHTFSSTSDYSLQFFYDYYDRDEGLIKESRHTLDFDFQHRFALLERNDVVWGAGYRYSHDDWRFNPAFQLDSNSHNDQLFSAFIQDEITLFDNTLWLTLGSKFEHNDYTGFEAQPTARLMWAPHHQHRLWAAASRAVRTPSRINNGVKILAAVFPTGPGSTSAITVNGNENFKSEEVISFEFGYRTTFIDNLSIDFTAFYNDYSHLKSNESLAAIPPSGSVTYTEHPTIFANNNSAQTYGFEIATVWQMLDWWRWDINYSLLKMEFDSQDAAAETGTAPQQSTSVRSAVSVTKEIDLDLLFRHIDTYKDPDIKAYVSMDIRLAWRPIKNLELSLVGQNLLADQHLEYTNTSFPTPVEIDRGMYGKLIWHFE